MALRAGFFTLLLLLQFSCENQEFLPESEVQSEDDVTSTLIADQLLIQSAQEDFTQNVDLASPTKSGATKRQALRKYPLWPRAHIYKSKKIGKIVIVPLFYPENLSVQIGNTAKKVSLSRLSHLFIYKDAKGKMHREVVTKFPSSSFYENPKDGFQGKVIIEKWNGAFVQGYHIQDDKVTGLSAPQSGDNRKNTCFENVYFTCVETPVSISCTVDYTETICEDDDIGGGSPIGPSPIGPDDAGGGGGTGTGTSNPGPEVLNFLCGDYNFLSIGGTIDSDVVANIYKLSGLYTSPPELFPQIFVHLPMMTIFIKGYEGQPLTDLQASNIFNTAWKAANQEIIFQLNSQQLPPAQDLIREALIHALNVQLNLLRIGSYAEISESPSSSIPTTKAIYCVR